jgi:hypothetical protein
MKSIIFVFLVIGATMIFFGCQEDSALAPAADQRDQAPAFLAKAKPLPNLIGTMDLYFELEAVMPDDPVWVGTITFEGYGDEIDDVYGMRFYHLSPIPLKEYSQASPFEERFEIYDLDDPNDVYLAGPDVGVTTLANKPPGDTKYRMNGKIEVASEPFEGWLGCNVHMSGVITWQFLTLPDGTVMLAPETAPGTFRIN